MLAMLGIAVVGGAILVRALLAGALVAPLPSNLVQPVDARRTAGRTPEEWEVW